MSRDYPPLTRKKQNRKDGREWVVAKYSYIYAIVIFAVALLCLIDVEAGLFMMPVFSLVGLPFLIAAINCRVTMNTEQVTVRNFFRISKTYSFFTGANHLESIISTGTPGALLSAGLILPLNICVGMVVACTMYGLYALFRKGGI